MSISTTKNDSAEVITRFRFGSRLMTALKEAAKYLKFDAILPLTFAYAVFMTGLGEVFNSRLSVFWYILVILILASIVFQFIRPAPPKS